MSISGEARLRNFLSGNSRFELNQTRVQLSVSSRSRTTQSQSQPQQSIDVDDKKLDMILRLLAKDEKDYQRMKASFKSFIAEANQVLSQQSNIQQGATVAQEQSFSLEISVTSTNIRVESSSEGAGGLQQADPLVLDLGGDGIELTRAGEGALFDINGDGQAESTAWVAGSSAFLALDKNDNGLIDSGRELFGDQNGAADGFQELARYDANGDRKIDRQDPIYAALKVYQDGNANGKVERNELSSLEKVGVTSISLDVTANDDDIQGNKMILKGNFTTTDGATREIGDALLGYR